jgi:hypothetical protein
MTKARGMPYVTNFNIYHDSGKLADFVLIADDLRTWCAALHFGLIPTKMKMCDKFVYSFLAAVTVYFKNVKFMAGAEQQQIG